MGSDTKLQSFGLFAKLPVLQKQASALAQYGSTSY
jgi:hypothetical protein